MRSAAVLFACLVHASCLAASSQPTCGVVAKTYDSKDVLCTIAPEVQARRLEFIVRFSGGHDDTRASIQTSMNDQALACDDGSKKELFAEDGNVSLHCRFSVGGSAPSDARVLVVIRWSHAEFTDYQLVER